MAGFATLAVLIAAILFLPATWYEVVHENAFDLTLAIDDRLRPVGDTDSTPRIIVVDIDSRSIDAIGPWPWPREIVARLVGAISATNPNVISIDILFSGADNRSPAALARRLGALIGRPEIAALAEGLVDGDKHLAATMANQQVVLGFVLDVGEPSDVPGVPVLSRGAEKLDLIWRALGADGPQGQLSEAAAGLGALSLPGDADGVVRRVPVLVKVAGTLRPSLALETVRLAQRASTYLVQPEPQRLITGDIAIPLPRDGYLRLVPFGSTRRGSRTISALDVLDSRFDSKRLTGAIVLIGGSAPDLGGLRPTAANPLTPSVQIHADAVAQVFAGRAPVPFSIAYD
jgi:adenylate cyclase